MLQKKSSISSPDFSGFGSFVNIPGEVSAAPNSPVKMYDLINFEGSFSVGGGSKYQKC